MTLTGTASPPVDTGRPLRLMRAAVGFCDTQWPNAGRFIDLASVEGGATIEMKIQFLTSFRALLAALPVKVFLDIDTRDQVLRVAQEALDTLIEESEA